VENTEKKRINKQERRENVPVTCCPRKGLPMITTALDRHIDMDAVTEALKWRAPAN